MLELLKFVRKKRRKICLEKCTVVLRAGRNVFFCAIVRERASGLDLSAGLKFRALCTVAVLRKPKPAVGH
jgi:hypothetical protein